MSVLLIISKNEFELRKRRSKQNEVLVNDIHEEELLVVVEQSCCND